MKIAFVVGARPNYMKVAPILHELQRRRDTGTPVPQWFVVHTGQHYDAAMRDTFFRDLGMPDPDDFLAVGSDTHARQTGRIMIAFDEVCDRRRPDTVVVVGDVNSTVACALVAAKRGIRTVHVEAGLRSFDRTMPEEVNRIVTDHLSDLLLITSEDAFGNLEREGIDRSKIVFVGNPMIDCLKTGLASLPPSSRWRKAMAEGIRYLVVTLHRPSNVDDISDLKPILDGLGEISKSSAVFFPVHPRTEKQLAEHGVELKQIDTERPSGISYGMYQMPPLGYLDFLDLMRGADCVVTDSGGVQEETTVLGIPCITIRPNTERPVTVGLGTNELVQSAAAMLGAVERALSGSWKKGVVPPLWDGRAAVRIVNALVETQGSIQSGGC